ncbi:hypothetical protein C882_1768 [Caenispirillum salinarum AK4]|uniref:Uncharacterized protein n=1 Tax=Caenispirillum salinarum AK4 TaxID=1238182 RepID=K9HF16_9PROT|nr:hypothetical protein [Caenispirillum salinarum]EKV27266.1 hypothetical protein C882_1768 [Caenispirillum salinarum AK4]
MPVEVHIPLTLRLDPALARAEHLAEVEAAVSAAARRALAEVDAEVIAPRGGYAVPRLHAPTFTWAGAAAALSRDWQQDAERAVSAGLRAAVAATPNTAAARLTQAPEPVPAAPRDRMERGRRRGGRYRIPSYAGGTADVPIYMAGPEAPEVDRDTQRVRLWAWDGSDADYLRQSIGRFLLTVPDSHAPLGQPVGVLLIVPGAYAVVVVKVTQRADGRLYYRHVANFEVGQSVQRTEIDDEGDVAVSGGAMPTAPRVTLRKVVPVGGAEAYLRERYYEVAREILAQEGASLDADMREALDAHAASAAGSLIHKQGYLAALEAPGDTTWCSVPPDAFPGSSLAVFPMTHVAPRAEAYGKDGGDVAAAGTAEDGGAGVDANAGADGRENAGAGGGRRGAAFGGPAPGEALTGPAAFYPASPDGTTVELGLGSLNGEPSLDELGRFGDALSRLMRQIAFRLEMPEGDHCGSFAIAAAYMIGVRASSVATHAETAPSSTRPTPGGGGNLGSIDMAPERSRAVQVMRYVAGVTPLLTRFQHLMVEVYDLPPIKRMITGTFEGDGVGWALAFYKRYSPTVERATGALFKRTCQIVMLQLLRASEQQIRARLANMDRYYGQVRALILGLVAPEADLRQLRDRLREDAAWSGETSAMIGQVYSSWKDARGALTASLGQQVLDEAALRDPGGRKAGEIVRTPQGARIRDADGRLWSVAELEQAIAFRHGMATSVDPLIHQFQDIPEVVGAFRQNPGAARAYLESLLQEMLANNAEMQRKTKAEDDFAFLSGKISDDLPNRTVPYTSYKLQGVHLLAHEAVGDAFQGDRAYAGGLDFVMSVELGRQGLVAFGQTVSLLALAVVCPPLAMVAGAGVAAASYADAAGQARLYGAMIDPEVILSKAQVEMDLFLAELEVVMAAIDVVVPVLKTAGAGARVVGRQGSAAGVGAMGRHARRRFMDSMAEQARHGIEVAVAKEVLTEQAMGQVMPLVLGPLMREIHREITIGAGGGAARSGPGGPVAPAAAEPVADEAENALIQRLEEYQEGLRDERLPSAEEAP